MFLIRQDQDVDTTFNFRSDTPAGKDPDSHSPTLRRYHRILWSKPLPNGKPFDLVETTPKAYLHHRSELGEFFLASDAVIPSFRKQKHIAPLIEQLPPGLYRRFMEVGYTIGAMMVYPGNKIDGKITINGQRGFHPRIKDRFDLTVECVRRHYRGEESPLSELLDRYHAFFDLFETFEGYVDFFLLQDIVTPDYSEVRYHAPFTGFDTSPVPKDLAAYRSYLRAATAFIEARNRRIRKSRRFASRG